ncbi:MAG: type II toxin-antitoxin system RelE/ParE family toxin [Cyanobacteria bacterium CRU_2_1]|nr:type II toxin-antitoxin system RelE/ParE family toxin [Cyanobacteria bacterium RU_5_0]NJR59328.1 type II toxin-antitoxin system RelE/ParE family toxin [Cyanobacteria bacterium CRU_2_1]
MSDDSGIEIRFTIPFKRRLKALSKRYRQIQKDIQPIIDELQAGNFIGDHLAGTNYIVFKVRVKNSDIPIGKSGGYRLIYQLEPPQVVSLLLIYAKSDQADVTAEEIEAAIEEVMQET